MCEATLEESFFCINTDEAGGQTSVDAATICWSRWRRKYLCLNGDNNPSVKDILHSASVLLVREGGSLLISLKLSPVSEEYQ